MKHKLFIFSLFIFYIVALTLIMMWQGIIIAPARYFLILILGSLLVKRARNFIFDWSPFLFIIISYDFLRGFVGHLISQTHYFEPIYFDLWLFKSLPTTTLQGLFFHPTNLSWYDFLATFLYFQQYIVPFSFAFLLWINNKNQFRQFVTGLSLVSYGGWVTYLLFPTAPPWLAGKEGHLAEINKIMDYTLTSIFGKIDFVTIYNNLNPNPIGSIPSMHAAWAFIIFLFALRFFKHKGWFLLPYFLSVWVSVIYLGEHYVIDVILGGLYALFFYLLSSEILHQVDKQHLLRRFLPQKWLNN